VTDAYPTSPAARDRWIISRRGSRRSLDATKPFASLLEEEPDENGRVISCATVFLTNRECPWRCVMCDLWQNTRAETVPPGAITAQVDSALQEFATRGPRPHHLKLYNSGSFFDPRAVPPEDLPVIAQRVRGFERTIVECHPALVGDAALRFRDLLDGKLEVAMGLETAHPQVLEKLNKRMTLAQFARAAELLRRHGIALRVFILVQPPFLTDATEALHWAKRSLDFAFDGGATVASLIPARGGNGAMEALAAQGQFVSPRLETLEAAQDYGLSLRRGRVFADLWDLEKFSSCAVCFAARRERLQRMNLSQSVELAVGCEVCVGMGVPVSDPANRSTETRRVGVRRSADGE
jgi:radical SAM enzyme (TIGR01210 family)